MILTSFHLFGTLNLLSSSHNVESTWAFVETFFFGGIGGFGLSSLAKVIPAGLDCLVGLSSYLAF